jgi:MFS transporter, YNFM family, putative membrane transport protein
MKNYQQLDICKEIGSLPFIQKGKPQFIRANASLFAGGFVTFAILYSTQPLLPIFSHRFHVTPAIASLTLSLATATLAIAMLVTSIVSESIGRKQLMAPALLLSSLLAIWTSFSPSFISLVVLRTIQGIVLAGFPAIAMVYVSEEFHPGTLGLAMGLYISGTSLGGMTGRILVGALTDAFSWRIALLGIGVISLIFSVYFWFGLPKSQHFRPNRMGIRKKVGRFRENLRDRGLLALYGVAFLLMGQFVTVYNYIGYLLQEAPYHLSQTAAGLIFVVYIVGTFSSTLSGKWVDRVSRHIVLSVNVTLSLIGVIVTLSVPLFLKLLGIAIFTFGFFGAHSTASGWVASLAKAGRAQASSLYLLFYYAGSSIIGAVGGLFWSDFGWIGVVGLCALLLCFSFAITTGILARLRPVH